MNKDYDAIRKKINKLEDKKKIINSEICSIREQRLSYKSTIDSDLDNFNQYVELSEKINKLRNDKDALSEEIKALHKQLIS